MNSLWFNWGIECRRLGIYFPYIQWLHHKGIVSIRAFIKICLMSVHNMFVSNHIFPFERSKTFLWSLTVLFWALIYFPMSDQKHSYDRSQSCSERSQRVFSPISFHHALEIYFMYIQWLHHKGIVSIHAFTKICLMSVHNMFVSDHVFPFEQSKTFLWSLTVLFWALIYFPMSDQKHSYDRSQSLFWALTEDFFLQFLFIMPWKSIFVYPVITPQRNCKYSCIHKNMPYEHS